MHSDDLGNCVTCPTDFDDGARADLVIMDPASMETCGSTDRGSCKSHWLKEHTGNQVSSVTYIPFHFQYLGSLGGLEPRGARLPGNAILWVL